MLAWRYAANDPAREVGLAQRFAALVAAEPDLDRLEHHRADVGDLAPALVWRSKRETAEFVTQVVADRFRIRITPSG